VGKMPKVDSTGADRLRPDPPSLRRADRVADGGRQTLELEVFRRMELSYVAAGPEP
jgi:hypothetical protein